MSASLPPRFCLAFATASSPSDLTDLESDMQHIDRVSELQTAIEEIPASVRWASIISGGWDCPAIDVLTNAFNPKLQSNLERKLHTLLDCLPDNLAYNLDVIWFCHDNSEATDPPSQQPPWSYSALKRAQLWHGARISVVADNSSKRRYSDVLSDLRADVVSLDDADTLVRDAGLALCWRGGLSVAVEDTGSSSAVLPGFELVAEEEAATKDVFLTARRETRVSRHLKLMAVVGGESVPPSWLTNTVLKLRVTAAAQGNPGVDLILSDWLPPRCGAGIIARLQYCPADQAQQVKPRSSEAWKKAVSNADVFLSPDEGMDKNIDEINFLIVNFGPDQATSRDFLAIMLDPAGLGVDVARIFDERSAAAGFDKSDWDTSGGTGENNLDLPKNVAAELANLLLTSSNHPPSGLDPELDLQSYWPEAQFLSQLEFLTKLEKPQQLGGGVAGSGLMTPSGEYIVLEAGELLKHFNSDCTAAKNPSEDIISKKKVDYQEQDQLQDYPDSLYQQIHGLHFNSCEKSEDIDREAAKVQRTYVGIERETATSCNTVRSSEDRSAHHIVPKSAPASVKSEDSTKTAPKKPQLPQAKQQSRRSGSRRDSAGTTKGKSKEEVFKQKLRCAVFDALKDNGVGQKSVLFKPCFKRLYDIVNMYGKDGKEALGLTSTSQFLGQVAKQNAKMVVDLQITLEGNKANTRKK